MAIFIKNEISHRIIEVSDEHESIIVEVFLRGQCIKVIHFL